MTDPLTDPLNGAPASGDADGQPARRRRAHIARWSALAIGLVVVALVAVLATRAPATTTEAESPLLGHAAPSFSARTYSGALVRLSQFRGRWALVNFFAPWCEQCKEEGPSLEAFLYSRPGGERTAVVGVLYGDTGSDGERFQQSEGATWPWVIDPGGLIASRYGVGGLPHSFLVAPNGTVVASLLGAVTVSGLDSIVLRAEQPGSS